MNFFLAIACIFLFVVFGVSNYRTARQKANALVEDFKRSDQY